MIDAIIEKYGERPGLTVGLDFVVEWPYDSPAPDEVEIQELITRQGQLELIKVIKNKATSVILSRIPEWKQRNMLGAALLINADINKTAEQKYEELSDYRIYLAWVDSVRAHSDYLEGEVLAGNEVDMESGWPGWPPEGLSGSVTI